MSAAIRVKKLTGKAFAIGVDVDQSPLNGYTGTILACAVKGLQAATNDMLTKIEKNDGSAKDTVYGIEQSGNFVGAVMNNTAYPDEAQAALQHEQEAKTAAASAIYAKS